MKNIFAFLIFLFGFQILSAQLPKTNIYLFDLNQYTDSIFVFKSPKYLTFFNANGYNNQPQFFGDHKLYITCQQAGKDQTDIVAFDLRAGTRRDVTETVDSEYSPTPTPDGKHFTCIREEADGKKTQRLWKFPINQSDNGARVYEEITGVGYHNWINNQETALFIVGQPHHLAIRNIVDDKEIFISDKIGRSFNNLPNGNFAFVHKISDNNWELKEVNLLNYRKSAIIQTIPKSEDFVVLKDGTFLMAKGAKLYKYKAGKDQDWLEIANFSNFGMNNISRIAISPNNSKIALVSN